MTHSGQTQSFTFFYMADVIRATDRSQEQTWSLPPTSSSAMTAWGWVKSSR
ncbi:MAG: hypothetical protein U0228_29240 [Myxococcaceae bacterium]